MCLLSFLVLGLPRVFTASASEALFLTAYGAKSLPYLYIIAAAVVPLAGFANLRLQKRVPYPVVVVAVLLVDGVMLVGLYFGVLTRAPLISGIVAVWFEVEWVLTSMTLWGLANQLFDVRQSKRVFGLIGAGELVATIAGGLLTPAIVGVLGTPGLLLCSAAGIFAGAGLIAYIIRRYGGNVGQFADEPAASAKRAVGKDRSYLNLIFALTLVSLLTYYCVNTAFYANAQLRYPDENTLAGFIGSYFAIAGVAGLFSRLVVARWMFARFGVKSGLLLLPVLLMLGSAAIIGCGATGFGAALFWLTTTNMLFDTMNRGPLYENAILTLYQALLPRRRVWAQTVVESQLEPLAGGIAGIGMLGLNRVAGFSVVQLATVVVPLALAWLVIAWKLKDRYVATLATALERRRLVGDTIVIEDAAGLDHIKRIIAGDRAEDILYAVALLERSQHPYLHNAVLTLLVRRDPLLRLEAARIIQDHAFSDALVPVRTQLEREAEPLVKGALIKTLGAITEGETVEALAPYLQAAEPVVRRDAIVALIEQGGIEGTIVAGDHFMAALRSLDPAERRLAAEVIGALRNPQLYRPLVGLLEDVDMGVRNAALVAAANVDAPRLRRSVIANLAQPAVRRRAAATLIAIGDSAISDLDFAFNSDDTDLETRLRIVAVLAKIRTPPALAVLEKSLNAPGEMLNHAILQALTRGNYVAPAHEHARFVELLHEAVAEAAWAFAAACDLAGGLESEVLVAALEQKVARQQERIFAVLSCLETGNAVRDTYDIFVRGPAKSRALVLELLDNVLAAQIRDLVFPVLDDGTFLQRKKLLETRFPQAALTYTDRLRNIAIRDQRGASPWLQACALYTIGIFGKRELQDCPAGAMKSSQALIRETARWAALRLDRSPSSEVPAMSSTIEKVIVLRAVEIFVSLPDEYLVDIAGRIEEIDVIAGEKIIAEGDLGNALFIIVEGSVRVHRGDATLARLGTREIFGELTALDPQPRSADVSAEEDSRLYKLEHEDLDDIMSADVEVSRSIIKMLCRRLRVSTTRDHLPGAYTEARTSALLETS